jgi:anthranilate phosphoribosyltransferase
MIPLLKEVGRGKRGARDLTYSETKRAAESIINGSASPAQIGAFLVAERIKMESIDELRAFIDTLRHRSSHYMMKGGIDCAGPYDGRMRTFIATLPTAFVLAACGLPTTLHGSPALPPKWGITLPDVLKALGHAPECMNRRALIAAADETGFLFIPTEEWCQPLKQIRPIRQELGLRTVYNSAEKLLRLSDAAYMAVGVFHGTVFEKMAQLISVLGIQSGIIIQGMEGSEDLAVDKRTRTYVVQDGKCELYIIEPELFELHTEVPEVDWTAELQAETALKTLRGEADLPYLNMVLLNSGVRLWIGKQADSIEEGIYKAKHAIESRAALQAYDAWSQTLVSFV